MADNQSSQGDKSRKTRPFGSFLLFLTVLVVILIAFGGEHLKPSEKLTQLVDETRFSVSYANLKEREAEFRAVKGIKEYKVIDASDLRSGIRAGWYRPEDVRHLTITRDKEPVATEDITVKRSLQEDHLFVRVTASSRSVQQGSGSAGQPWLPEESSAIWFKVENFGDLGPLKNELTTLSGVSYIARSFDLREGGGTEHGKASPGIGQIMLIWGPWILIFGVFLLFMRQMRQQGSGAGGVMSFGRSRAQLYSKENHTNVTFDDVAGADEAKDEVREVVEFLKNPGRFTRIGGRIPRGVLLVGSPGCGKTLLAKAIAGEAEVPFYSISGSDFVEMFVGVGASRVRDLFKQARENSPCIIFLDEIDAVGRRRGSGMGGGHDEREQTLNAILVEMDGFGTDEGIILVAATNRPDVLDPALLRPGRFDREVTIDLPDMDGRREILNVHLKKVKVASEVDVQAIARSTPGYSGADLGAIVNEAAIMAVLDKKDAIEMQHLEEAAAKVRYGRQKISRKIEEEDRKITAYHESGHTIVDHMQKNRMLGQLAMAFGGRAAEAEFCGDISAGASDDIRRATELARAMVTELGMSEKVGPINYAERQGSDFLGTELMSGKWHSEETARVIDEEVERLLREAYQLSQKIVHEHGDAVERLTEALLIYETVNAGEIMRLIDGTSPSDLRPAREEKEDDEPIPADIPKAEPTSEAPSGGKELPGDLAGEAGLSPA